MKSIKSYIGFSIASLLIFSCQKEKYGINLYDANPQDSTSGLPQILSFSPEEGIAGDTVVIKGMNLSTVKSVSFGGNEAASFEVKDDSTITAILASGNPGKISIKVTNRIGSLLWGGFIYIDTLGGEGNMPAYTPPNLALNKPASSDGNFNSPALSVDGDTTTRWSAPAGAPWWYQVDLEEIQSINRIHISWDAAYASAFKIEVSTDNNSFKTVYSTIEGTGGSVDYTFDYTPARYVKITLQTQGTPWNMSFWEFEVYSDMVKPPKGENLALKKAVATPGGDILPPANAVDGNPASLWQAGGGDNQWIVIDLGRVFVVDRVKIIWQDAFASGYSVEVSPDNKNWTSVFSTTSGDGGDDDISFSPEAVRYVKVQLNAKGTPWNYSIYEIEVY